MSTLVVPPAVGVLTLTGVRQRAALLLEPVEPNDPVVLPVPVDAVEPPALVVGWEDPWVTLHTVCLFDARLAVICLAGRVTPDAGVEELERLVTYVHARIGADGYGWRHETTRAPRVLDVAGVPLLSARVVYTCPVTMGGN